MTQTTSPVAAGIVRVTRVATPAPWRHIYHGGDSTVVADSKPSRNDTRIPPYACDEARGHCIGYIFLDDKGDVRRDFVCFSHADAALIAAAPELLAALQELLTFTDDGSRAPALLNARAAIARAGT